MYIAFLCLIFWAYKRRHGPLQRRRYGESSHARFPTVCFTFSNLAASCTYARPDLGPALPLRCRKAKRKATGVSHGNTGARMFNGVHLLSHHHTAGIVLYNCNYCTASICIYCMNHVVLVEHARITRVTNLELTTHNTHARQKQQQKT